MAVILLTGARTPALDSVRSREAASTKAYAVTSVAVVDVEKGQILSDQAVVIVGDRIANVVPQSEVSLPNGIKIIDGKGLYLMPGLVDAHVHYFDQETFGRLLVANRADLDQLLSEVKDLCQS